jgi:hypothetical protein
MKEDCVFKIEQNNQKKCFHPKPIKYCHLCFSYLPASSFIKDHVLFLSYISIRNKNYLTILFSLLAMLISVFTFIYNSKSNTLPSELNKGNSHVDSIFKYYVILPYRLKYLLNDNNDTLISGRQEYSIEIICNNMNEAKLSCYKEFIKDLSLNKFFLSIINYNLLIIPLIDTANISIQKTELWNQIKCDY